MYKNKTKNFAGLVLFFVSMLLIIGCSSNSKNNSEVETNSDGGVPKIGGEAVIAFDNDISNYDPIKGSSGFDHALLWPVYDTLISFNTELEPQPGLAKSWDVPDDKTLVLHLREDVTFHDGTKFDAEAVKFNIERINSDESKISDLKNIENVEVVDSMTVKLHLKQPDSSLVLALSDRGGMMVSPTAVKENEENLSQLPVGTGPYKVKDWIPNQEVIFEAFDHYWGDGKPYLDKMTVKIMTEENTRINALKSGEVDFAYKISASNIPDLERDSNITVEEIMGVPFRTIYINSSMAPLDNKAVRLAILYGIDRDAIIQAVNFGKGESAYQPFPKSYWAADKDLKIEFDPEKSKQILDDAGLDNISFTLIHYANAYDGRFAEAIKGQLKEVGIDVNLQAMEENAANNAVFSEKQKPALLAAWTGRPDPQMTINYLFTEDSFFNPGGVTTPEIESLINKAYSSYDQDDRAKLYNEISKKAILEEALTIPLFFNPNVSAMNNKIKGYEPNMLGKPVFSTLRIEQ